MFEDLQKYGSAEQFEFLRYRITQLCYEAFVYEQTEKEDALKLKRSYSKRRDDAVRAIKTIKEFIEDYPHEGGWNFALAFEKRREKVQGIETEKNMRWKCPNILGILDEYENIIKDM